jgi:hypothetical protein
MHHARCPCSADDPEDVAFLHDQQVFAVNLDFGARPFAEQDLVAGLDVQRGDLAIFGLGAGAGGDDFPFLGLFLGGVGNDDAASRFLLGLYAANQHAIVQGTKAHGLPFLPVAVPTGPVMGVDAMKHY